ncbi:hypothetical protein [Ruminococcus sp.]|uniref:hypothetical protein n=1 Tax=Ruminococcus sp. TaxID=41978 RepID=UPI002E809D7B|nr:hypothetical protein [Ruminococcus sp.]MEE3492645.1 hypothetical protein [Ruminococcus sp.]
MIFLIVLLLLIVGFGLFVLIKDIKKGKRFTENADATVVKVLPMLEAVDKTGYNQNADTDIAIALLGSDKTVKYYPVFTYQINLPKRKKRNVTVHGKKYRGGQYTYYPGEVYKIKYDPKNPTDFIRPDQEMTSRIRFIAAVMALALIVIGIIVVICMNG